MKRYSKLLSQSDLIQQMVNEKGYREKEVKMFLKELNDVITEDLSCGYSVHLFPGLYLEVMQHPGQEVWSFKENKKVRQEPYPILFCRLTAALKDKVYATEEEIAERKEHDKSSKYGYDD